jgi:hypothetical protein
MGANLAALYDYNRVVQSGTHDHQPLQRFIGHTDVVTAVAAGEGIFKECFLSGGLRHTRPLPGGGGCLLLCFVLLSEVQVCSVSAARVVVGWGGLGRVPGSQLALSNTAAVKTTGRVVDGDQAAHHTAEGRELAADCMIVAVALFGCSVQGQECDGVGHTQPAAHSCGHTGCQGWRAAHYTHR